MNQNNLDSYNDQNYTGCLNPNALSFYSNKPLLNSPMPSLKINSLHYQNGYFYSDTQLHQQMEQNFSLNNEYQNQFNYDSRPLDISENNRISKNTNNNENMHSKQDSKIFYLDEMLDSSESSSNKKSIKGKSYQALRQEKQFFNKKKSYTQDSNYFKSHKSTDNNFNNISNLNEDFRDKCFDDTSINSLVNKGRNYSTMKNIYPKPANENDDDDDQDYKKYGRDKTYAFERNNKKESGKDKSVHRKHNLYLFPKDKSAKSSYNHINDEASGYLNDKLISKFLTSKHTRNDNDAYYTKNNTTESNENDSSEVTNTNDKKTDVNKSLNFEFIKLNCNGIIKFKKDNWMEENQRELLIEQLSYGSYECMVCYYVIKKDTAVWNCSNCYHVFHLYCIKKWAKSSTDEETRKWRCPGCQNALDSLPRQYFCYCGKKKDPEYDCHITPHSCGEVCGKKRANNCIHPCNILCHPGPCPLCLTYVNQLCKCGKKSFSMKCHLIRDTSCGKTCGKPLNCEIHVCDNLCHNSPCNKCEVNLHQVCFCGAKKKKVPTATLR